MSSPPKKINRLAILFLLTPILLAQAKSTAQPLVDIKPFFEPRYEIEYHKDFFKTGQPAIAFNQNYHLRIGIVIENKTNMAIKEILNTIFTAAPLDRYRGFFQFTMVENIDRALALKNYFLTAYDGWGNRIAGGYDLSATKVRANLIILRVQDSEFWRSGTKGYSIGSTAVAQRITILHELGHVLAQLGDEYSIKKGEDYAQYEQVDPRFARSQKTWHRSERANLDPRSHPFRKWQPLIDQGILPQGPFPRRELNQMDKDHGRFFIPSESCIMNNPENADAFCPVCQLQIIESIARLTGTDTPWG